VQAISIPTEEKFLQDLYINSYLQTIWVFNSIPSKEEFGIPYIETNILPRPPAAIIISGTTIPFPGSHNYSDYYAAISGTSFIPGSVNSFLPGSPIISTQNGSVFVNFIYANNLPVPPANATISGTAIVNPGTNSYSNNYVTASGTSFVSGSSNPFLPGSPIITTQNGKRFVDFIHPQI
jgi:hypothetical protein